MDYIKDTKEKWGNTKAYKEFEEKTKDYSEKEFDSITDGLTSIFCEFTECMESGEAPFSPSAQSLVEKLRDYITDNFYTCTDEILSSLGKLYVSDGRFKNNIDKGGYGTAEFASEAISFYCEK